jgi:ABC-type multidrug transport system ATPase subunit
VAVAIKVNDLRKSFGEVEAVRGVDFEVDAGEVFGFLGPNGAGKTTTINMLCTLARPTGGSATARATTSSASATTSVATSASSSRTRRSTAT